MNDHALIQPVGDVVCERVPSRWRIFSQKLLQKSSWSALQRLGSTLPDGIMSKFDEIESITGHSIDKASRKRYFREFFRKASGSAAINMSEMEELICTLLKIKKNDPALVSTIYNSPGEKARLCDFPAFVSILSDVHCRRISNNEVDLRGSTLWGYCYHKLIPIHPDFLPKQAWDLLIILLLLYSSFQVPYKLAFEDDGDNTVLTPKEMLDISLDVIFMLDVAFCFVTSYHDTHGVLVTSIWTISKQYMKTWFLPDLGGSFPFDKVISMFLSSSVNVGALRILKLVRMLKLLRAAKVFKALRKLGQREGFEWLKASIGIAQSTLIIVFFAHILGCFFTMIFVPGSDDNWMYHYNPELQFADGWTRYITALYWAMISVTTMGYGDIYPVTHQERLFCIFVAMIGAIVFSYCVGTISSFLTTVTGVEHCVNEKYQSIDEYTDFRKLSREMKRTIKSFYTISWRKTGDLYHEKQIVGELANHHRKTLLCEIGLKARERFSLFQGFDNECVGFVMSKFKQVHFLSNETIYQRGDPGMEAFVIISGNVNLIDENDRAIGLNASDSKDMMNADAGDMFGEIALFPELATPTRINSAVAKTSTTAFTLSADDIPEIRSKYPAFVETLQDLCILRLAEHRMHGRACAGETAGRSRASGRQCKLKALISELQRDLLVRKTRDILVPASGPDGSKVLSLFIVGSDSLERKWVSISCVVSERGELLCFEHTPVGALRDGARSLGFFLPGKSTFSVLSAEEVDKDILAAQRGKNSETGFERPLGCKVLLFEYGSRNTGGISFSSESMDTCIYTWMADDFGSLIYSFEQLGAVENMQSILLQPKQQSDEASNRVFEAVRNTQHPVPAMSERTDSVPPGTLRKLRRLPLNIVQVGKHFLNPLPPVRIASSFNVESDDVVNNACRTGPPTSSIEIEESMSIPQSVLENLIGNLEWLAQKLEKNKDDTVHLSGILLSFLKDHATILQNIIDHPVSPKPPNNDKMGIAAESRHLHHQDSKEKRIDKGDIEKSRRHALNGSMQPPIQKSVKINGGLFGSRIFPLTEANEDTESNVLQEGQNVTCEKQVPLSKSNQQRWQSLARRLVLGTWNEIRRSAQNLPDSFLTMFNEIEREKGCRIDEVSRRRYFKEFFRKAAGSAAITVSEAEELLYALLKNKVDDLTLQTLVASILLDHPHEKTKLFDFPAFVSILCDVKQCKSATREVMPPTFYVWAYFYHKLIPIHPDALPKQVWDLLIILLLLYSSFQVPYKLAFEEDDGDNTVLSPKEMLDISLDVIFMLDVAFCFVTSFHDTHGVLVTSIWTISKQYMKTWFLPDLGGSFPFDKVISIFLTSAIDVGALRILKLVRMLKLLRAAKVFKALRKLGQREGFEWLKATIGISQSVLLIVFFAHILGCFFTMFFVVGPGDNWMYHYNPELEFADGWTRYLAALYWAMISITTMGYGDIRPVTSQEQLFCIFVATTGVIVFSYCMGTISALATDVTGVEHAVAEKMQSVSAYIRFRKISKDLKIKVKSFYTNSWRKSGIPYNELELLNELPNHLSKDVLKEIGDKNKQQIPILLGFENECIGFVLTRIKRVVFVEGDVVYRYGDHGDEAFFIVDGTICLSSHQTGSERPEYSSGSPAVPAVDKVTSAGDVFGELALFPELAHTCRIDTAVAKTFVTALSLSADHIPAIRSKYPVIVERIFELCTLRLAEHRLQARICASEISRRRSSSSEPCKIKTIISQLQRNLLIRKTRDVLLPASGQEGSKVLSLFMIVCGEGCTDKPDWVSISCVVSEHGELLCFENTPMGAAKETPKSLGFFVSGYSKFQILKSEEIDILFLSTSNGAKPHGCKVLVYDTGSIGNGSRAHLQTVPRELLLFSWLDDEFDSLIAALSEQ